MTHQDIYDMTFPGEKCYFVSDLHINHKNICRGTSTWKNGFRNLDTLESMNYTIFKSINDIVKEDDYLFHGGDFMFGDKSLFESFRKQINCKNIIHFFGNHDKWMRKQMNRIQPHFMWMGDYSEFYCINKYGHKKLVCMGHYPIKSWNEMHHNSYMISGHVHGNLPYSENEKGLDVGWDNFNRPLNFYEIDEILSKRVFKPIDHHNKETH